MFLVLGKSFILGNLNRLGVQATWMQMLQLEMKTSWH